MRTDWREAFIAEATPALAAEYGDANPRYSLQGCSAEDAARTAIEAIEDALELFRRDALYRGVKMGEEFARERVREAYEDGRTDRETIIRAAGPQEGRKRDVPRNRQDPKRSGS